MWSDNYNLQIRLLRFNSRVEIIPYAVINEYVKTMNILFTEFSSPPPSITQLYHDRRNVWQWYTFWFAVVIAGLTVVFGILSSVTAYLSTKYAYQALLLAREAAAVANICSSSSLPAPTQ